MQQNTFQIMEVEMDESNVTFTTADPSYVAALQ